MFVKNIIRLNVNNETQFIMATVSSLYYGYFNIFNLSLISYFVFYNCIKNIIFQINVPELLFRTVEVLSRIRLKFSTQNVVNADQNEAPPRHKTIIFKINALFLNFMILHISMSQFLFPTNYPV